MSALNKVNYVQLGSSGLQVSKIILGCMTYGNKTWAEGWCLDEEESLPHFKAAWDLGINTWDTADIYCDGDSERLIAKAIKKFEIPRDELVIATKLFHERQKTPKAVHGSVNQRGLSRKHIFEAVRGSLERLETDYIDILYIHQVDEKTPISETMDALNDLVRSGKVHYLGISNAWGWQIHQMQNYAVSKGQAGFVICQPLANAVYREAEKEIYPVCKLFGMGICPWSPLAKGYLTKPAKAEGTSQRAILDGGIGRMTAGGEDASLQINSAIEKIAKARGKTMAQIAIAWSCATTTAPVCGTSRIESLSELVEASHIELTAEERAEIESPYRPRPQYEWWA